MHVHCVQLKKSCILLGGVLKVMLISQELEEENWWLCLMEREYISVQGMLEISFVENELVKGCTSDF